MSVTRGSTRASRSVFLLAVAGAWDASAAPDVAPRDNQAEAQVGAGTDAGAGVKSDGLVEALLQASNETHPDTVAAEVQEFKLNAYGFADFTYSQRLNDFPYFFPYPSFAVGGLNLYVGAELGRGWRSLAEFRLLYLPNGAVGAGQTLTADGQRIDTTVADPTDFSRPMRWSGIEIERVWLEYSFNSYLTIQAGQWLTPYGIWNVDHGSPAIIGVRRPYVVGEALIPERQTGIQIYGSYLTGQTELGYNLGLSNGRGPIDAYQDLDRNKALTARLFVTSEALLGTLTLGATVYRGRYTDRFPRYSIGSDGAAEVQYVTTERFEELGISGDLRWVWRELTLQSELVVRDVVYDDVLRPATLPALGAAPGFVADFRSFGWYAMAAYRLPWSIMPFVGAENYDAGQAFVPNAFALWGGVNVRPVPRVVLKAQYTRVWFPDDTDVLGDGVQMLDLQAAWSF